MAFSHTPVVYAKNTLVNLLSQRHLCFKWLKLQQSYDQILAFVFLGVVPVLINVWVVGTNFCQWIRVEFGSHYLPCCSKVFEIVYDH